MSTDRSTDNVLTTSEKQMTLGGRIFASRQNAGISLHMAASLLGVKHATLKSWENDRSEPRVNKLVALAGLLGVSPTHFLAEEGDDGLNMSAKKGSRKELVKMLKEEISHAREEQKKLNQRLRKIDELIQAF